MASTKLTEYERERLENIRRNSEMMASLKVHSIVTEISQSSKRIRELKKQSQNKKPRAETTPIVIRRSLRARGMPPDSKGLDDSFLESMVKNPRPLTPSPKPSPRKLGPLSMREAYRGEGSDRSLIEKIRRIAKESIGNESAERVRVCKFENSSGSVKEEGNECGVVEFDEVKVCNAESSSFLVKKEERETEGLGLCGHKVFKNKSMSGLVKEEVKEIGGLEFCGDRVCKVENSSGSVKEEGDEVREPLDIYSMSLNPKNIVRILSDRIMALRFFPCASSRMIVAGNKLGDVGFWNLDHEIDEEGEDGVCTYHSHSGPVAGISIHPHHLSKVYTSCYNGFIRLMDAEKEIFDLIYSSEYSIFSLAQRSNDAKCLYFGEGYGGLNIWDERSGKCSAQRILHTERINSIDFNSDNTNLLATSSSDGTASIWDLRSIDANKPKSVKTVNHQRSVHSAYFSPSGTRLATTSFDNTVGVLGGANFEKLSSIQHNNQTGRWISPFKAIWGWSDAYIFIGNMKRGIDIIAPTLNKTIYTLESPNVSAIPCRFDVHPYNVGTIAGATGGGQVYVWTLS